MAELRAILITVGDELLNGRVVNGNAAFVGGALLELGIPLGEQRAVGDQEAAIRAAIEEGARRFPLVLVSGGLGPTPDDRTRAALAAVAGVPLIESAPVMARLTEMARRRGWSVNRATAMQAMLPAGAELLDNPLGQAPGIWLRHGTAIICALPGVPAELQAIMGAALRKRLVALPGRREVGSRTLHTIGVAESELMLSLTEIDLGAVSLAYLPGRGRLDLRLDACGDGAAAAVALVAAQVRDRLGERFGPIVYGEDDDDLAGVVLDELRCRDWRLGVAESCTGGLIAGWLTDHPGSSAVLAGGLVTYADQAKVELLGVRAAMIAAHGAVSAEVAAAMAAGVRQRLGVTLGLAVTGIAGPGGGTPQKPVGLVELALAGPRGPTARTLRLGGNRRQIRQRSATQALDLIRRYALAAAGDAHG